MILPSAPRRPSRVAAVALLLALHLVAIEVFVHLRTTRERVADRLGTLLLLDAVRRPTPRTPTPDPAPARPPRPLVAPIPPIALDPQRLRDSATPIATLESSASGPATGATAPTPGAASAPLNLAIPKAFYKPVPLSPAQEAMNDPRSNRLVLTRQEKLDIAFGVVECIAWQREPDGSIYRGPGHRQRIHGISTNPFTAHKPGEEDRPTECVK